MSPASSTYSPHRAGADRSTARYLDERCPGTRGTCTAPAARGQVERAAGGCSCGSLDKLIDASGNATSWEQDLQGRVTKETRADGSFKTFVYENTTSRLKSVTDARNQTKTYGYALDDRLTSTTYTNAAVSTPNVTFSYMDPDNPSIPDPYGRLRQMTDGAGTTRYDYKPAGTLGAGSLSSVDGPLPSDTVSYSYDELGRVTTHGLTAFSTISAYDALGRLNTLTSPMGNFLWTYVTTSGRPQTVTYPNNQITTYTYFPNLGDQRLQQIKHQQTAGGVVLSQFDYAYDAVGNIKTWTQQRGSAPVKTYILNYDPADQLLAATVTGPNPPPVPSRFRYAYDAAGNRSAEQLDDAGMGASYNSRNQLTSRQPGGTLLFRGTLNEQATVTVQGKPTEVASNNSFAAQAQVGSTTTDVVVAATDPSSNTRTNTYRVTQSGSTTTYTHDPNGNLTGDGTKTFEWDAEDRMTRVCTGTCGAGTDPPNMLARFVYDGQGRRAQKIAGGVTRSYVYDGENIIEERLSGGQTYNYVHGPAIDQLLAMRDQGSVVSYYLPDHLGSIAQTTSNAAAVTLTREYDPWGNPIQGSATNGFAFTGREWDGETGLYYYRARYYDPRSGRFLSEDPVGLRDGPNRYKYVHNAPVNAIDPFGLTTQDCLDRAFRNLDSCTNGPAKLLRQAVLTCAEQCKNETMWQAWWRAVRNRPSCFEACMAPYRKWAQDLQDGCIAQYKRDVAACQPAPPPTPRPPVPQTIANIPPSGTTCSL